MVSIVRRPVPFGSHRPMGLNSAVSVDNAFEALLELLRNDPGVFLLDSSINYVDATEPVWWVDRVDSSTSVPQLELDAPEEDALGHMPTSDQVALVVHALGFSKRQLAELFGVSRQAIYDWLNGKGVSGENAGKLSTIAGLLMEVTADTRRPLHHQFTTQPLTDRDPSILDLLRADPWDIERILAQLHRARELTTQLLARQGTRRDRITQEQGDHNFEDNLLSLGVE